MNIKFEDLILTGTLLAGEGSEAEGDDGRNPYRPSPSGVKAQPKRMQSREPGYWNLLQAPHRRNTGPRWA